MFNSKEKSILAYNGSNITFELADGEVMVNLTEMAKAFGKRPNDFLGLPSTNQLIKAITRKFGISENQAVIQKQGAPQFGGGTWANRLVALSFAQWLSVDFHLICLEKIEELLTQGVATTSNDDEAILHAMQVLQKRVEASKQKIQMLEGANEMQKEQIKLLAPKAEYTDAVLQSTTTYTFTQIAKDCEMTGATTLANFLISKRVIYRQSGQYMPTAKYSKSGYFKNRTHTYENSRGEKGTNTILVVTEAGRKFIHNLISKTKNA